MAKRGLTICLCLAFASAAHAGAMIDLVPSNPGTHGPLMYDPGETFDVVVDIHNEDAVNHLLRLMRLDTSLTDPAISLNGQFTLDFSSVVFGDIDQYAEFLNYPRPSAAYTLTSPNANLMFNLPAAGTPLSLGMINLTLPTDPGTYTLDVVNNPATDPNQGAQLTFGFGVVPGDDATDWRGNTGDLTGGSIQLTVVPEPATLSLLALGGLAALRFRRRMA